MKKKCIYIIAILLTILVLILVSKSLLIKLYIISKIEQPTLNSSFTRKCYLDNDLQVIEYVTDNVVLYEYYDENNSQKNIIDIEDFNSKKIYSIDTTTNIITDTRDFSENFTQKIEYKETLFNQNKVFCEDIKNGSIKNFRFASVGESKYIVFQVYQNEFSNYTIFFLNLNTNFIDKAIMISENNNYYSSVVRDYNITNENNSSKIDLYLKMVEGS